MNPAIENQIREYEARLYAAMLASDVDELDALIADDLLFVGPTGELATKEMDLKLHRSGTAQFRELMPEEMDVRVWSDEFVLVSARIFLSGHFQATTSQAIAAIQECGVEEKMAGKLLLAA